MSGSDARPDAALAVPAAGLPAGVRAFTTTRAAGDFGGARSGDDVMQPSRRVVLAGGFAPPGAPCWLRQVHGRDVFDADGPPVDTPIADASVTRTTSRTLAILTADCLPVVLAASSCRALAVAHAGWRGLAAGVIEAAVAAMRCPADAIGAWLGPAIGPSSYEVGEEVRAAFVDPDAGAAAAFSATRPGHWLCDLYALARRRLAACGIAHVSGGGFDTRADAARFHSYRRDGAASGRMATLAWLEPPEA